MSPCLSMMLALRIEIRFSTTRFNVEQSTWYDLRSEGSLCSKCHTILLFGTRVSTRAPPFRFRVSTPHNFGASSMHSSRQ